jgi:hypothetical protein
VRVDVSDAAWAVESNNGWTPSKLRNTVWFSYEAVKNEHKSNAENRPVFDEVLFLHIRSPGDKLVEIDRKATVEDKRKYAQQLEAFLKREDVQRVSGTPLEAWPLLDRRRVAELKAINIHSVDQLANLNDGAGHQIMDFHDLRAKARNFLSAAKGETDRQKVEAELQERDSLIKQQGELLKEMQQQIQALEANQKKKAGRPRKEVAA